MKSKFSILLPVFVCLLMACAISASAQDDIPGQDSNSVPSADPTSVDDKPLIMEQNVRAVAPTRDSLSSHSKPSLVPGSNTKPKSDPKKKEEVDPLNFNFLYYIIQKFKASDLME